MIVEASCKFCQRPVKLHIDPDYDHAGDPLKLQKLASCNRCADYFAKRKLLSTAIQHVCEPLGQGLIRSEDAKKIAVDTLRRLIVAYIKATGAYKGMTVPEWDENILTALVARPLHFGDVLARIPKLFVKDTLV